jgi:hypothetical protein
VDFLRGGLLCGHSSANGRPAVPRRDSTAVKDKTRR